MGWPWEDRGLLDACLLAACPINVRALLQRVRGVSENTALTETTSFRFPEDNDEDPPHRPLQSGVPPVQQPLSPRLQSTPAPVTVPAPAATNTSKASPGVPQYAARMQAFHQKEQDQVNVRTTIIPARTATVVQQAFSLEARWIPAAESVLIAGLRIPGMVYVGREMRAVDNRYPEPALINPLAHVSTSPDILGATLNYWPSYCDISPNARCAYLQWLASGRRTPETNIGYVFLFFYGLERRALHDAQTEDAARDELPSIAQEVEALLDVYGEHNSFKRYASAFLEHLQCMPEVFRGRKIQLPSERVGDELPMGLRRGLGILAKRGAPVPASWAYAWVTLNPEVRLRMPAVRCATEFKLLFGHRYRQQFGDGMTLKEAKQSIIHTYRPASAGMHLEHRIQTEIPDVCTLRKPQKDLRALTDSVTEELEAYSRLLGKSPQEAGSLAAAAILPAELVRGRPSEVILALVAWIKTHGRLSQLPLVETSRLLAFFFPHAPAKVSKKDALLVSAVLGKIKVGLEPDLRFSGISLAQADRLVLFPLPANSPPEASSEYTAATLVLHLASQVVHADGVVTPDEERHLEQQLETAFALCDAERIRLRAHLRYLLANPQSMNGMKKRLQEASVEMRQAIAECCAAVACAGGGVEPGEIKVLQRIFKTLGLEESQVYAMVHGQAALVQSGRMQNQDNSSPRPSLREAAAPACAGIRLDATRIAEKLRQTEEVARFLDGIFSDEEEAPTGPVPPASDSNETLVLLPGLDQAHTWLLRRLLENASWPRDEYNALVRELGLMADGAIETINEAAFTEFDAALIDADDDPILIETSLLEEYLHVD